jgi:hypothetical protein
MDPRQVGFPFRLSPSSFPPAPGPLLLCPFTPRRDKVVEDEGRGRAGSLFNPA